MILFKTCILYERKLNIVMWKFESYPDCNEINFIILIYVVISMHIAEYVCGMHTTFLTSRYIFSASV